MGSVRARFLMRFFFVFGVPLSVSSVCMCVLCVGFLCVVVLRVVSRRIMLYVVLCLRY